MSIGWLSTIIYIACAIIVGEVFIKFWKLINQYFKYIKAKAHKEEMIAQNVASRTFKNYQDFYTMLETLVNNEVVNLLHRYADTATPYPMARLKDDVEKISKSIYDGLRISEIANLNVPIKPQYMMNMIVKMTTRILARAALTVNNDISSRTNVLM